MTRRSSTRSEKSALAPSDLQVTPEDARVENPIISGTDVKTIELPTGEPTETPTPAPAADPEKIQTDVRQKLAKRSTEENAFVPSNPASLEKAATEIAKERGFEFNRGTAVGARLIARAQQRF